MKLKILVSSLLIAVTLLATSCGQVVTNTVTSPTTDAMVGLVRDVSQPLVTNNYIPSNVLDADGNLATLNGFDYSTTSIIDNGNGTFTYNEKWLTSYATLLFNTPDGDLNTGDYALDGGGTGYYIRTVPVEQGQFIHIDLNFQDTNGITYSLNGLQLVSIVDKESAYYDEFLTAQGAKDDWTVSSQYYGADFSTLPIGDVVRQPTTEVLYDSLKNIPNFPQPVRTEIVSTSAIPAEPIGLPNGDGIGFDATSNSGALGAVSSYSWNHTCGATANLLVFGEGHYQYGSDITVTGVTYNGSALTHVAGADAVVYFDSSWYFRSTIFYLLAPATGSAHTVSVTLSGTQAGGEGGVCSYSGAKQTGQPDNSNSAAGATGSPTVNVVTSADNCWVFSVTVGDFSTLTCGNTQRWNSGSTLGFGGSDTNSPVHPAGSQTMSWTASSSPTWVISAVSFAPLVAAPSITVSPTTLNFGTVMPNTTYYAYNQSSSGSYPNPVTATQCYFTITNNGSTCNIALSCSNATGGNGWTLVGSSPTGDQFEVVAVYNGENPASGLVLTNANQAFYTGLAASGTLKWDFKELLGGTGTGKAGTFSDSATKTYTITITGS